jgi:hypothetical protein
MFLKCYQLPNAEKAWYTCMFEDLSGVIVTQCLALWSNQVIQKDESTVFSIKSMIIIIMITTQWYFFVKILAIPLKFAYGKREWMLIDLSEHIQLYRTKMAEVISAKPSALWWCKWWHDSHNFRMKNLYKQSRKCR